MRSKDIRLALIFIRCRTRLASAQGLAEGLGLLAAWLNAFPDAIHPQMVVDADQDAALEIRMNALQALTDTGGLMSDVREISLTKSSATRLQIRDIERAFAHPRPSDALAPESVTMQLDDLSSQEPALFKGFEEAASNLGVIEVWARAHLEGYEPDFAQLRRVLNHVSGWAVRNEEVAQQSSEGSPTLKIENQPEEVSASNSGSEGNESQAASLTERRSNDILSERHEALQAIRAARHWFERNEPSSPIPVLLRRAESCVGKRYAELVNVIPADLLMQWESE